MCSNLYHGTVALTNNSSYVVYTGMRRSGKYDYLMTVLFSTDPKIGAGKQYKVNSLGAIWNAKRKEWNAHHPLAAEHGVKQLNNEKLTQALKQVGR